MYYTITQTQMVFICDETFSSQDEEQYKQYFEKYPYMLSSFQKYAIKAIVEGQHVLSCVPTGSGKTLAAEFAIEFFKKTNKRTIYTSPVKALSNQKYHEFTTKFPDISFGIITGDIKANPEADVLIMTTEILMNALYAKKGTHTQAGLSLFEMDFETQLACVVFDEVHMIGDKHRGRVWEETILMLPPHVQMVMLSATLDNPAKFANWCETKGNASRAPNKEVYLSSSTNRIVPLTHYSFITCTEGLFKKLKDKDLSDSIKKNLNKPILIQDAQGVFNTANYQVVKHNLDLFNVKQHYVKRQHVLNSVSKYLVDNNMLPAICFVLSRKALEQCANEVTTVLLEDDSKTPYIVKNECEQFIRKLPNANEYLNLPEFHQVTSLLEKGVAIHHAGMMPVLREMVELLFSKGHIKMLFATETFSIGINMPAKTSIFIDMTKFDGSRIRNLHGHEYTQMGGRAGRRGIDTVGHVIHLTNLFRVNDMLSVKTMMKGSPQSLSSQFKISYNLLLNLINMGELNYTEYSTRSMYQQDLNSQLVNINTDITEINNKIENTKNILKQQQVNIELAEEYIDLNSKRLTVANKKRKEIDRKISTIMAENKNIEMHIELVASYRKELDGLKKIQYSKEDIETNISNKINAVIELLEKQQFVTSEDGTKKLTDKGIVSTLLRELHCLVFADILTDSHIKTLDAIELVGLFSCFTNISVTDDLKANYPASKNDKLNDYIELIKNSYDAHQHIENETYIDTGFEYTIHYDIIDAVMRWCKCNSDVECKIVIEELRADKGIFLGEFIKALLKINNIAMELEKVAEHQGDMEFLQKVKTIPQLTLKYVATNQSLYV